MIAQPGRTNGRTTARREANFAGNRAVCGLYFENPRKEGMSRTLAICHIFVTVTLFGTVLTRGNFGLA
jgi:hypothetical protein